MTMIHLHVHYIRMHHIKFTTQCTLHNNEFDVSSIQNAFRRENLILNIVLANERVGDEKKNELNWDNIGDMLT